MAYTKTSIANLALLRLNATTISDITDTNRTEAVVLNTAFDHCAKTLAEAREWQCMTAQAQVWAGDYVTLDGTNDYIRLRHGTALTDIAYVKVWVRSPNADTSFYIYDNDGSTLKTQTIVADNMWRELTIAATTLGDGTDWFIGQNGSGTFAEVDVASLRIYNSTDKLLSHFMLDDDPDYGTTDMSTATVTNEVAGLVVTTSSYEEGTKGDSAPAFGFAYSVTLPDTVMRINRFQDEDEQTIGSRHKFQGGVLYSDSIDPLIWYNEYDEDATNPVGGFTPSVVEVLRTLLAQYTATSINGDEGLSHDLLKEYQLKLSGASKIEGTQRRRNTHLNRLLQESPIHNSRRVSTNG